MSSTRILPNAQAGLAAPVRTVGLGRWRGLGRFLRRNPALMFGLTLLLLLFLFAVIGAYITDPKDAQPLAARPLLKPSAAYPFGTDKLGRDLFATIVAGIPLTLRIGFLAGLIGLGIGTVLGFVSAYYGGWIDNLIRGVVDVGLTIPGLMVLIILAISFSGRLNVNHMALIVAVLAWLYPARVIRSQVLTLKQRPFIEVARLTGMSGLEIIFLELMPNLLPYLAASLVGAISAAILASIGLEALGLGPVDSPTLGMTIYWAILNGAVINRWWWWWAPPILVIAVLFNGLYLLSMGLDEIANPRGEARAMSDVVLQVRNLRVQYETVYGPIKAVNDVSFDLHKGEILGLVGESGSGKTTLGMALVGLIRSPARVAGGEILLNGRNLVGIGEEAYKKVRLAEIALIPQGAMNSLNPVTRLREQILDGLRDHGIVMTRAEADQHVERLLERVGLRAEVANMHAHELSGGMKQRVAMAIAISMKPKIIIADEPTSALDVVVQKRVIETLQDVQAELGASIILVGHDMGLMAQTVDRLGVMYAGRLAEIAPIRETLIAPQHPYTRMLIESLPSVTVKQPLRGIPGLAPQLLNLPSGCAFHPRCPHVFDRCITEMPALREAEPRRWAACHLV